MSACMKDAVDTVRRLLALASDAAASEAEIEKALRFARRYMERWGIDESSLTEEERRVVFGAVHTRTVGSECTAWQSRLAWAVCDLVGAVQWFAGHRVRGPDGFTPIHFYGPEADAKAAAELFREWSVVIRELGLAKYKGWRAGPGRSYCEGYARALREKVQKLLDQDKRAGDERALVAVRALARCDGLKREARSWLASRGVHLAAPVKRAGNRQDPGAYAAGKRDGQNARFTRDTTKKLTGGR